MIPLPAPAPTVTRPRAPRGGVVIAGRFFRGGCYVPYKHLPAPAAGTALAFDLTRDDLAVAITNPATGNTRHFQVATMPPESPLAGRRVAMVRDDAARRWDGFAFADDFGLHPWRRLAADKRITGPAGYIALLTESARFAARGLTYSITA